MRDDIDTSIRDTDRMDIIQNLAASFWVFSPIGAVIFVGLTALFLTGVPARILDAIDDIGWSLRCRRKRRVGEDG